VKRQAAASFVEGQTIAQAERAEGAACGPWVTSPTICSLFPNTFSVLGERARVRGQAHAILAFNNCDLGHTSDGGVVDLDLTDDLMPEAFRSDQQTGLGDLVSCAVSESHIAATQGGFVCRLVALKTI